MRFVSCAKACEPEIPSRDALIASRHLGKDANPRRACGNERHSNGKEQTSEGARIKAPSHRRSQAWMLDDLIPDDFTT
jgi:hypothetical protein